MTLKRKILTGYGFAVALMGIVLCLAISHLVSLGRATNAILSENYRSILAAENMVGALEGQNRAALLAALGDTTEAASQLRANDALFVEWLARAKDNITIEGEAELVRTIETQYAAHRIEVAALVEGGESRAAGREGDRYRYEILPGFAALRESCVRLLNLNERTMFEASWRAGRLADRAIWSTAGVAGAALLLALGFSWFLAERIAQPVRRFMDASRKISAGDYAVEVPVETTDELGRLAEEINHMARQLARYHELNIDQIISEKNKSEAVLASIEDGLVIFDKALRVTGINPAARRFLGSDLPDGLGLTCSELLPDARICGLVQRTIETGASPRVPEEQRLVAVKDRDGQRQLLCSVTAIRGRDRVLTGGVLLLRDVTSLKEVERMKSEFVTAASHELRTPLTSLGMSVDLLLEHAADGLAERDRDLLRAAQEEVCRMKALVGDLLELARSEVGRIDLEFRTVQVRSLFENVAGIFRSQAEMHGVNLIVELDAELPEVRADAAKVTWVLTNLISNALRYVPRGGHIALLARKSGPQVQLSVRDDGPGIHPDDQVRIFEKFVQGRGQIGGGAGLGLAICKEIVRAHGGRIWVDSSLGTGSTFSFTLPAVS